MKKQTLKTLFLLTFTFFSLNTFAESGDIIENGNTIETTRVDYNLSIENEVSKELKKEISINTKYEVNLEELEQKLKIIYPEKNFRATWEIKGGTASNQEGFKFERTFKEKGIKEIELVIYEINNLIDANNNPFKEEKILYTKDFEILVFEKIIPIILSNKIKEEEFESYVEYSKKDGILIYKIGPFETSEIELANLTNEIDKYSKIPGLKFDYLTIWGDRDFIFDILSKINRELTNSEGNPKLNIVAISPYNINVLKNYLKNFLTNKTWLNKIIITNENSKFFILKEDSIKSLETELQTNKYEYLDVSLNNSGINKALFLSNFINTLSNLGFSTNNIYIFLIIPIILLIITFFKHFIGLSPIGIAIPTFLTILFFKLGFFVTLFLIFAYLIVNFSISVITSRYNLLYVPKMTFILTLNIILLVVLINIGYSFNLLSLDLNDTIYFVIFLLISEKVINILLSKDLIEYKGPFFYTLIISIVAFLILSIGGIKILILAYPEFLVFLIPINFIMGRFTGLRMTEYIRFKEVIKNIEE